jgi:hypothetical protein
MRRLQRERLPWNMGQTMRKRGRILGTMLSAFCVRFL